jgi:hypothetical protein
MLMVKEVTILPLERPIAHLAKFRAKKAVVLPKTKPNLAACMKRGETTNDYHRDYHNLACSDALRCVRDRLSSGHAPPAGVFR